MKQKRVSSGGSGFVSKLSKGLMLPIALLPIAGLFLGIGSGIINIMNQTDIDPNSPWYLIPTVISQIGNVIFANLAILFAIGVAIAFTNDSGVAAFSAFVAWLIFNVTQSLFIWDQLAIINNDGNLSLYNYYASGDNGTTWNDILKTYNPDLSVTLNPAIEGLVSVDLNGDGYIDLNELNYALIVSNNTVTDITITSSQYTDFINWFNSSNYNGDFSTITYDNVLFYEDVPMSVITSNVGISSMQTSVFGGIIVGLVTAWLYNKFYKIEMPKVLGFFSGTKFVPIIVFLFMPLVAFIFLFTWPPIGSGLESFGEALGDVPYGLDALIFGLVERSLVPFGLHHAFYTPLWYTSAGGSFYVLDPSGDILYSAYGNQYIWFAFQNYSLNFDTLTGSTYWYPLSAANAPGTGGSWGLFTDGGYSIYSVNGDGVIPEDDVYFVVTEGVNPGSYMQGKYSFMIFGLPAAGFAIVMSADKNNREMAMSIILAAALTSFLTGITEPLEFTFLFVAPMLYGFHIIMCGISFWFADVMHMSMGMTFSGGIIDFALYGILPWATGIKGVEWWWSIALGLMYIPIYYFFFSWYIRKFDVKTPGRDSAEIKLVSKAEYLKAKGRDSATVGATDASDRVSLSSYEQNFVVDDSRKDELENILNSDSFKKLSNKRKDRVLPLINYLGGFDNLDSINSCITRLRLIVNDRKLVDEEAIKNNLKASGIVGKGKNLQIIFGAEADIFKSEILDIKKEFERKK